MKWHVLFLTLVLLWGCGDDSGRPAEDEWGAMNLTEVWPRVVVPSTLMHVSGGPFPDDSFGTVLVHLSTSQGEVTLPGEYVSPQELTFQMTPTAYGTLAGSPTQERDGDVTVWVEAVSARSGASYLSSRSSVSISFRPSLVPSVHSLDLVVHYEERFSLQGEGLLVGAPEGLSRAVFQGCFTPTGQSECTEASFTVTLEGVDPRTRQGGEAYVPVEAFGPGPGTWHGTVTVENTMTGGQTVASEPAEVSLEILPPEVVRLVTESVSYTYCISIEGLGLAPQGQECGTEVTFDGWLRALDGQEDVRLEGVLLVPHVHDGIAQIVLDRDYGFGRYFDVRKRYGLLDGTFSVRVCCGQRCEDAGSVQGSVVVEPVLQVVYIDFKASYVSALRDFGLGSADSLLRERIKDVVRRVYDGINVRVVDEEPQGCGQYTLVEIHGYDPNGLGLLGYDNSVGKDVGNERLYDRIGGVNALTQEDGYPGYGGVFLESFFGFSEHPPKGVRSNELADPLFDEIFDPVRPDRGGRPATMEEITSMPEVTGADCPAQDRAHQVACAVYVLGELVGGTVAHELGHSFGLAEPGSDEYFHNIGDAPYRLMDSGGMRPFVERAGLEGEHEVLCRSWYQYLRAIMRDPDHEAELGEDDRPGC